MIAITRANRGLSKLTPTFIICVAKALESGRHLHNEHLLVRGLPAKMHKLWNHTIIEAAERQTIPPRVLRSEPSRCARSPRLARACRCRMFAATRSHVEPFSIEGNLAMAKMRAM